MPRKPMPRRGEGAAKSPEFWQESFSHYLASECHLAANTVAAYRRDLGDFLRWAEGRRVERLALRDLSSYTAWLHDQSFAAPTIARHVVSLKMFYRYLQLEGLIVESPAELLGTQTLWERIPHVLSIAEVDKLLAAPVAGDPHWHRDRALLELLYATGCRASEASGVKMRDLHLADGYCVC